jgi:stage V sporulation protein G
MSTTIGVEYVVLQAEHVRNSGRMVAVATVEVTIAGVAIVVQGIRVMRRSDGGLECLAPAWRHPRTGRWLPCLLWADELSGAIAHEVLAAITDPRINPPTAAIAARPTTPTVGIVP